MVAFTNLALNLNNLIATVGSPATIIVRVLVEEYAGEILLEACLELQEPAQEFSRPYSAVYWIPAAQPSLDAECRAYYFPSYQLTGPTSRLATVVATLAGRLTKEVLLPEGNG